MAEQEFRIHIVSDADNTGFKSAADASDDLAKSTTGAADAGKDFFKTNEGVGESAKAGEGLIERLGLSHRSLHQILHLIARESGPQMGAAVAGAGALAGGGIGIGIAAVTELVTWLNEANEAAEKVKESTRSAFIDVTKQAAAARTEIEKTTTSINTFFDALAHKSALEDVKTGFAAELQRIKDIGDAAANDGLTDKDGAAAFVDKKQRDLKITRAGQLDESTAALTKQLEDLKAQIGSEGSIKGQADFAALKADLEKLNEAFKSGTAFRPTSSAKDSVGILTDNSFTDPENEERRKQSYEKMSGFMEREIATREKAATQLQEHIKLLEGEIERRTTESKSLKSDVDKSRETNVDQDLVRGVGIAKKLKQGDSVSESDAQYIVILEQAITGHKQTLQRAVALILAQSSNLSTAQEVLSNHQNQLSVVHEKLLQLSRQSAAVPMQVK